MPLVGTKMSNYTFLACFKPPTWRFWAQTLKLNIHLTKSPKRDPIYKLFLYTLEEHKCLILTS